MKPLLGIIVCTLFLAGCKSNDQKPSSPVTNKPAANTPSGLYDAVVAKMQMVDQSVEATGTILAAESTDIHSEIAGRVVGIYFQEGSYVKRGQLLVKLFDRDLLSLLNKQKVQLRLAKATEQRQKELLEINGTSRQEYDNATLAVSNIAADMEMTQVNISKTEIRAPYNGRVGLRNISLGAYLTPSTFITNVSQTDQTKVIFTIPEQYAPAMQPGRIVSLKASHVSQTFSAKIIATDNSVDPLTRNLQVKAMVQNAGANLKPGVFVQTSVYIAGSSPSVVVPARAIVPTSREKKVFIVKNGTAVLKTVETGIRQGADIQILHGLQGGDTILVTGLLALKDGSSVKTKIVEPK